MLSLPTINPSLRSAGCPPGSRSRCPPATATSSPTTCSTSCGLETVCENARCPNRPECWSRRTATFMILGNVCTRPCGFCSVPQGRRRDALEDDEPDRVAEAAVRLGLKHVVITSVTRDDLPDGGADHFRRCILAVPRAHRGRGRGADARLPRRPGRHRPRAVGGAGSVQPQHGDGAAAVPEGPRPGRATSAASTCSPTSSGRARDIVTKSGLMLGLGETIDELFDVLADLRAVGCDVLTLGQYLAPTLKHDPGGPVRAAGGVRRAGGAGPAAGLHARWWPGRSCGPATTPTRWSIITPDPERGGRRRRVAGAESSKPR